jgi:NADPH2:quinone reductase
MRALQYTSPASTAAASRVADVAEPSPGEGQVAIAVSWAGVNFKDVMQRRGDTGYVDSYPFVPGLEVSGTVVAVGPGVPSDPIGRRVCAVTPSGGLAQVAVADFALAVEIPDSLSERFAAAAPGALTSAALLVDTFGRIGRGDVVLVHSAAGAVGRAVAQLARHRGAAGLIGMVGAATRVQDARSNGYDEVFVRGEVSPHELRSRLHPAAVDLVIDPLGTVMLDFDLALATPGTRIIITGNASGSAMADLPPIPRLMGLGVQVGGFSLAALMRTAPEVVAQAMRTVLGLLDDRVMEPALTSLPGLSAVPAVHDALAAGEGRGKYVVDVSGGS